MAITQCLMEKHQYTNTDIDWDIEWEFGVLKLVLCEGDVNDWVVLGSVDIH